MTSRVHYLSHGVIKEQQYPTPGSRRSGFGSKGEEYIARQFAGSEFEIETGHGHKFPSGWRYYDLIVSYTDFNSRRRYALVEVDGEQHFRFSFSREGRLERLNDCQRHDIHKTRAALKWGVPILRIHYKDIYNIDVVNTVRQQIMGYSNLALSRKEGYEYLLQGLESKAL